MCVCERVCVCVCVRERGREQLVDAEAGMYVDKYGVVCTNDGPFWPTVCVPVFPAPKLKVGRCVELEPLYTHLPGECSGVRVC